MKKYLKIGICSIFILVIGYLLGGIGKAGMSVYQTDIMLDDLIIRNFTLACSGDTIYFPYGCFVEHVTEKDITEVSVSVECGKQHLGDTVMSFDNVESAALFENQLISGYKISRDATVLVKVRYKAEGEEKEFDEEVKLKEHMLEKLPASTL